MHQTIKTYLERDHSILLSVTRTLYVYQVCHGVGRCVKRCQLFFEKPGANVNGQHYWHIVLSQQMSDAIKHITDGIFFFQEDSVLVHMLDFTVNRVLMKLFKTSNIDIISNCRDMFGIKLPSVQLSQRFDAFMVKWI